MKIYILPTSDKLQPDSQKFEYPYGNPDYGVEQDFLEYLKGSDLLTESANKADWHYLPVFWTRWHLNHEYGKEGLKELQSKVNKAVINFDKTFTICQYDDGTLADLKETKVFLASRKGKQGIDIPLLRNEHKLPLIKPRKKYLASFIGRLSTHPIRQKMAKSLGGRGDVVISDGDNGQDFFVKETLRSYISLCPRGYGGSSFRFYEAMQLGVVPFFISNEDTRPFKKFINWDTVSLFTNNPDDVGSMLKSFDKKELLAMGKQAKRVYERSLRYGKWGDLVIKELGASL